MVLQMVLMMNISHGKKEGKPVDTKYMYVCHAELNAILNFRGTKEI